MQTLRTLKIGGLGAALGLLALAAPAAVKVWLPTTKDGFASTPANWSGHSIPLASDDIVLNASSAKIMTWDAPNNGLPTTINSWRQESGYTGKVTVNTLYPGPGHEFTNFVIRGNLTLSGGTWTHGWNTATNVSRLAVTVGGNFTLGTGAALNAGGLGYTKGGPGFPSGHGGTGRGGAPTYDSITEPALPGSSSASHVGGGAILLAVGGNSLIDGVIRTDGSGWGMEVGSAGGSVLLRSGTLSGSGAISANGHREGSGSNGGSGGSGGRVAVILTQAGADFSDFSVSNVTACGTAQHRDGRPGFAAGTVYLETPKDGPGNGQVIVDNNSYEATESRTTLPPMLNPRDRLAGTRWTLRRNAAVFLAANAQIAAIDATEDTLLDLGPYTLKTRALTLGGTTYPPGLYQVEDLNSRLVIGTGRIAVQVPGAPEVANRGASRVTRASATLSGTLLPGADHDTTVTVFWGPIDGGRTRDRWAHSQAVTPDAAGRLSAVVANLPPDSGLWFTFFATNSKGDWWAEPPLFFISGEPAVTPVDATVTESTLAPAAFLITRPSACAQGPLALDYTLRGTASNGVDYIGARAGTVLLAPGQLQALAQVFPTFDLASRPAHTVTLDLDSGPYVIGARSSATVTIADARLFVPDWWDSLPVHKPQVAATATPDAYWGALTATNPPLNGVPMDDWFVVGPFDGANGAGFDTPYPPEKAIRRDAMKGKGGINTTWQPWKPGQPCPVPIDTPDAVFYVAKTFVPEAPEGYLQVTVDDKARVWIDDQPIHTNVTIFAPVTIPVHLSPGSHRLLVKIWNGPGTWSCRVGWSPVDPRRLEIKLRTLQAARFASEPAAVLPQAERLAALARDIQDGTTFEFWAAYLIANTPSRASIGEQMRGWAELAKASPVLFDVLAPLAVHALGRESDPAARAVLGAAVADLAASRRDPALAARAFRAAQTTPTADTALRMLSLYDKDTHATDLDYWLETYLAQEHNDNNGTAFVQTFQATATDFTLPLLYASLETMFLKTDSPEQRAALARRYVTLAFERNDSSRLHAFMQTHGPLLASLLPFDTAMWRLRLALMDLDQDAAKAALEQAAACRPGYREKPEYNDYLYRILKIRASATTPSDIDFSVETIRNNLQKLSHGDSPDILYRFIRDTLTQKGTQVVAADDDHDRFIGSKTLYRALCEPYRPAYSDYLSRYTTQLDQQGTADSRLAARLRVQAALTPPPAAAAAPLPPAGLHSAAFAGARPLVALAPGVLEWVGEASRTELKGDVGADLYATEIAGDLTIIQDSRAIAALRDDRVVWSHAVPLSSPWTSADSPLLTGGRFVPAIAGEVVITHLMLPDEPCGLVGLNRADGRFLWRWTDDSATPVSSPAAWDSNRVVFIASQAGDSPFTHKLVFVIADARTGRPLCRLPLAQAQRDLFVTVGGRDRRLDFYRNAPRPTVEGSIAYVDTAAGLIGAIDLADESLMWLRVYPRQLDPLALAGRLPGSPVTGRNTVLFAPFDSNQLLLVDKRTGQLIARRTDLPWTSVAAGGPGTVSVLTGNAAYWFSLDRLDETLRLAGRRLRHIQSFGDGALIQDGDIATLYTPAGTPAAALTLPAGVQAARWTDGRGYGFGGPWHGTFVALETAASTATGTPLVVTAPPADTAVRLTRSLHVPSGALIVAGSIVTRFDDQGRRIGELPAADDNVAGDEAGRLALLHAGRLWLYREPFTYPESVWPANLADGSNAVLRVAASAGTIYALAAGGPGGSNRLLRVADGPPVALGLLPAYVAGAADFVVSEGPTRIAVAVSQGGNAGHLFELKRTAAARDSLAPFDHVAETAPGQFLMCPDDNRRRTIVLGGSDRKRWTIENGAIGQDILPGDGPLWTELASPAGQLAACQTKTTARLYEPVSGRSLDLRNVRCWMVAGTTVYGAFYPPEAAEAHAKAALSSTLLGGYQYAGGDASTGQPFRVDLAATSEPTIGSTAFTPLYNYTQRAGQITSGSTAALILRTIYDHAEISAVVWEGASPDFRVAMMPHLPAWTGILQAGPRLIVANETPFSGDEFRRCLTLESAVTLRPGGDAAAVPRVDGFLDEWQTAEFTTAPRGRYAVRRGGTPDDFWLAVEITDPIRVERLAAGGLDDRIQFVLTTGPNADFFMDSSKSLIQPVRLRFPGHVPKIDAAWSITPDATRATIEIHVADTGIRRRERKQEASAEVRTFGDLAFRLVWQADPFSPAENLLETRAVGPLSFERVVFGD